MLKTFVALINDRENYQHIVALRSLFHFTPTTEIGLAHQQWLFLDGAF